MSNSHADNSSKLSQLPSGTPVYEYKLNNGLQILVKPDHRAPVVLAQIWYKVGSVYEPNGITGISHMLEHMMFKGTKVFEPGDIETLVQENGGEQNAFTYYDYTAYYQFWDKTKLDLSFQIEASRMHDLKLDQKLFNKEKQVVMEERRMRTEDNPISFANEKFMATANIINPRHHPVIGWMSDIQQYDIKNMRSWYKQWYAPNNAVIVVVGDVVPEDVYKKAQKYFADIPSAKIPVLKQHPELSASGEKNIKVYRPNVNVPTIIMGFNTPSIKTTKDEKEIYALIVLDSILGDNQASRLQTVLDRKLQYVASIYTSYDAFALNDSIFTILALANNHSLNQIQSEIMKQINELIANGITSAELERVKVTVLANKIYEMDSFSSQASLLGSFASIGLSKEYSQTYLNKILEVTDEDVKKVAKKYLTNDNLTVAELLPEKSSSNNEKNINSLKGDIQEINHQGDATNG